MQINKNLTNLSSYQVEIIGANIARCHANELGSPILPIEVLATNIFNEINFYPEKNYQDLIAAAAKFYNTNLHCTIPVNGSDEGLDFIIRTLCNPGDTIAILNPTFPMYKQYAIAFGLESIAFNLDENFEFNINNFINFCKQNNPKLAFIPNPLAPTGGAIKQQDLIKIITNLQDTFIVIDEAYIEFSKEQSMLALLPQYKNLIITRTLSKFFGLAGIRLGFVFTQLNKEIFKIKSPYNVNQMTSQIGINLFQNLTQDVINNRYTQNLVNKEKMKTWLGQFKEVKQIYTSDANFLFLELDVNAAQFAEKLLMQYNMKIKIFTNQFSKFCRISYL